VPLALVGKSTLVPVGPKQLTPGEIVGTLKDIVSGPYEGPNAAKIGMTKLEAAIYSLAEAAADGDHDALERILNRLMGKPVQQVVQATGSLSEFLDMLAKNEPAQGADPDPMSD